MKAQAKTKLIKKIEKSLTNLIRDDEYLLIKDLSELSITHKLAEKLLTQFPDYDVDCEYNGNCESEKGKKRINILKELIPKDTETEDSYKNVFPDIIIHKRGTTKKNHCIIELKKSTNKNRKSLHFDYEKLKAYTTNYYGNELNYNLGIFILINTGRDFQKGKYKENYELTFFIEGEESQ